MAPRIPMLSAANRRPVLLELRSSKAFIIFAVSLATFTDIFFYAVITPVLPFALEQRMGVAPDRVQYWVSVMLAVYGAALLVGSPICGYVADITKTRRAPLLFGLLVLAGATVMLTVAKSVTVFVIGRALQGLSAAIVWVVGLALVVDTVGKDKVGEAMGYIGLALSLSILLAPLLGGVVFAKAGYYAVFAMCFALLAVDIVLRLVIVERKVASKWLHEEADKEIIRPHDEDRSSSDATTATPEDIEEKTIRPVDNETSAAQLPPRNITLARTVSNSLLQARRKPRLFHLLSSQRFWASLYGSCVQAGLVAAFDSTLPIFVRTTFGWTSLGAGLIFLPVVIPTFVSPLAGHLADRFGAKLISTFGFLVAVPFLVLLRLVDHDSLPQKVLLCFFLVGFGLSTTCGLMPLMAEIAYTAEAIESTGVFGDKSAYAQAYGLFNTAFAAGTLIGPIWGGMIREHYGWGTMGWTLALWSFTTAVVTFVWTGGKLSMSTFRWKKGEGHTVEAEREGRATGDDQNGNKELSQAREKVAQTV